MNSTTRRDFLRTAAVTGALTSGLSVHAEGGDLLRVGLIGCGGRGTGAAAQALQADPNVKLVAMGDVFADRLETSLTTLKKNPKISAKVSVEPEKCFLGFDAYLKVIQESDVVLLTTPPHFRPQHFKAAVEAGKHIFAEKPVAVDAPGVRSVLESAAKAKEKKLSVVSGLCLRYDSGFRETVKRLRDGAIGEITFVQANDYRSSNWAKPREKDWNEMTYQMRNWYNYTWLSGDFNVEQHVHYLDVCAWILGDRYPIKALGLGGRASRNESIHGNIFDHFSVIYEYADGTKFLSNCRQQTGCANDMSASAIGTRGRASIAERRDGLWIKAAQSDWRYDGPTPDMYQVEHDELFASIRKGQPINNTEYMAKSTLLAIMGRMAAYTGKLITWEMALNSKELLAPSEYSWEGKPPEVTIAVPGVTKFS
jgi:predicted dehydrogenase